MRDNQSNFQIRILALSLSVLFSVVLVIGCKKQTANTETSSSVITDTEGTDTASTETASTSEQDVSATTTKQEESWLQKLKHLIKPEAEEQDNKKPARFGNWGEQLATEFAQSFPDRYAGSDQEKLAADYLADKLTKLGYEVERQEFSYEYDYENYASQNLVVTIPGIGFRAKELSIFAHNTKKIELPEDVNRRTIIVGAHYDTPKASALEGVDYIPDGIHNNAAGVASLMTFAKQALVNKPGYTVKLVFFGASNADYAGANAFLNSMSEEEIALTDCMYNVDSIYAGDKVYMHSGWNSLSEDGTKKYDMRRKLYQITDLYYQYLLYTNNNFEVYTNQSLGSVDFYDDGGSEVYREWTKHSGDHTPFDKANIPIVFCESYDYNPDIDRQNKETQDPQFSEVNGYISGSGMDSSEMLNSYYAEQAVAQKSLLDEEDEEKEQNRIIERLENRINNVAFLLLEASRIYSEDSDLAE